LKQNYIWCISYLNKKNRLIYNAIIDLDYEYKYLWNVIRQNTKINLINKGKMHLKRKIYLEILVE
jgi:hypothetical protein